MNDVQKMRRDLHQIPELDRELPKTLKYIKEILKPLRCKLHIPTPGALIAYFHFDQSDTLAYRSDMDALPIIERNQVSYISHHPGRMHACGHDGHMAMLLKFAQYVNQLTFCPHNVLLIFQPAEETDGGAKSIVASGVLNQYHVKAIFGFHLWPNLSAGVIATKPGSLMAQSGEVTIDIRGKAAHITNAQNGRDALNAAMMMYHFCDQMKFQISDPYLLSFGYMESGNARNVISDHARLLGTMRTFAQTTHHDIKKRLLAIGNLVQQRTGCEVKIHISDGYPTVYNDPELFAQCQKCLPHLQVLKQPNLLSEDFAFYGKAAPSLFMYLGTGNDIPLHADTFDFDDSLLINGVQAYIALLNL